MIATQPNFTFDPELHVYQIDGRTVPSVTEIIGTVLPGWQAESWYLGRGRALHAACDLDDRGCLDWDSVAREIEGRVLAWRKFRRECPVSLVESEHPLASARHRYAGTFDRIFDFAGKLVVCDLKSTCEPQVRLQLGAYSLLIQERDPRQKIVQAVAVELRESEEYRTLWINERELRRAESQFLATLSVFNFMRQHNLKGNGR